MFVEVKNLTHVYSEGMPFETVALDNISFAVKQGEFVALIGHTGSGKSTLLQHINGLLKPTSGEVIIDGVDINQKTQEARDIKRKIGIVFQYPEYQLFEEDVMKDVCFGPKNMGLSEEQCITRARRALELVEIDPDEKGNVSPFSLSGGEKRRVAIAGVLAMEPEFLILDEPTAGLDPKGHADILNMISKIREEKNMSILLVTHNMDDAALLADRILVMDKGSLVLDGSPKKVFSQVELIESLGLSLPSASSLMVRLDNAGYKASKYVLSGDEAVEEILKIFK